MDRISWVMASFLAVSCGESRLLEADGGADGSFLDLGDPGADAADASDLPDDAGRSDAESVDTSCLPGSAEIPEAAGLAARGFQVLMTGLMFPTELIVSEDRIYVEADSLAGGVYSSLKDGCDRRQHDLVPGSPSGLSWLHAARRLFWVDSFGGQLYGLDVGGAIATPLGQPLAVAGLSGGLAPTPAGLYWLSSDCSLHRTSLLGDVTTSLTSTLGDRAARVMPLHERDAVVLCRGRPASLLVWDSVTATANRVWTASRPSVWLLRVQESKAYLAQAECDNFGEACILRQPGCCPGSLLEVDLKSGAMKVLAEDPVGPPLAVAVTDRDEVVYSNGVELIWLGSPPRLPRAIAPEPGVEGMELDGEALYWSSPRRLGDLVDGLGYVVRAPLSVLRD